MAYFLVNKQKDERTLCTNVEEAKEKLKALLETCESRHYTIERHDPVDDEFPSYLVHDQSGSPVGEFTILLE